MNEKWREGVTRVGDMSFAIKYMTENMPEWDYEANLYCAETCYGLGNYVCTRPEGYVFKAAIEALEKRIPQKPVLEGDGYWNGELVYDTWTCPSCGEPYEIDYSKHDYCPMCGQAIDWGEVENE